MLYPLKRMLVPVVDHKEKTPCHRDEVKEIAMTCRLVW